MSFASLSMSRVALRGTFTGIDYLYFVEPYFSIPEGYTGQVSMLGVMIGKSVDGADPIMMQACASNDGSDMYHFPANGLQLQAAQAKALSCGPAGLPMCTVSSGIPTIVNFGIPLAASFVSEADFDGRTSVVVRVMLSAYSAKGEMITSSVSMSYLLTSQNSIMQYCTSVITGAQTLSDVITCSIYVGLVNDTARWNTAAVQKKVDAAVPNGTFNAQSSLEFQTTTVQGAFITFAAMGKDSYFLDPRALDFNINIHDIHTVHFLEPLSGKSGPSPNYDSVVRMLNAG